MDAQFRLLNPKTKALYAETVENLDLTKFSVVQSLVENDWLRSVTISDRVIKSYTIADAFGETSVIGDGITYQNNLPMWGTETEGPSIGQRMFAAAVLEYVLTFGVPSSHVYTGIADGIYNDIPAVDVPQTACDMKAGRSMAFKRYGDLFVWVPPAHFGYYYPPFSEIDADQFAQVLRKEHATDPGWTSVWAAIAFFNIIHKRGY